MKTEKFEFFIQLHKLRIFEHIHIIELHYFALYFIIYIFIIYILIYFYYII